MAATIDILSRLHALAVPTGTRSKQGAELINVSQSNDELENEEKFIFSIFFSQRCQAEAKEDLKRNSLTAIDLSGCKDIRNSDIEMIAQNSPHLKVLNLSHT